MSLNKMLVIGNLGGDPEMRYTANGSPRYDLQHSHEP